MTIRLTRGINFTLQEASGAFTLQMHTQEVFACNNHRLKAALERPAPEVWQITLLGVEPAGRCIPITGEAFGSLPLGELAPTGELRFVSAGEQQVFAFTLSEGELKITPTQGSVAMPLFPELSRLPPDTAWLVVFHPPIEGTRQSEPVDSTAYQALLDDLVVRLEELGAEIFLPPEGVYTNLNFLPPWPTLGRVNQTGIIIPVTDAGDSLPYSLLNWAQVFYFRYTGNPARLVELVQGLDPGVTRAAIYFQDGSHYPP
jgi:hypothetical protein